MSKPNRDNQHPKYILIVVNIGYCTFFPQLINIGLSVRIGLRRQPRNIPSPDNPDPHERIDQFVHRIRPRIDQHQDMDIVKKNTIALRCRKLMRFVLGLRGYRAMSHVDYVDHEAGVEDVHQGVVEAEGRLVTGVGIVLLYVYEGLDYEPKQEVNQHDHNRKRERLNKVQDNIVKSLRVPLLSDLVLHLGKPKLHSESNKKHHHHRNKSKQLGHHIPYIRKCQILPYNLPRSRCFPNYYWNFIVLDWFLTEWGQRIVHDCWEKACLVLVQNL